MTIDAICEILEKGTLPEDSVPPELIAYQQAGYDLNKNNHRGTSLLHVAIERGHIPTVRWLLENKANPNQLDLLGKTPLMRAAFKGDIKIVELLLEHGADAAFVTPINRYTGGETAIYWAARSNGDTQTSLNIIGLLLCNNADPVANVLYPQNVPLSSSEGSLEKWTEIRKLLEEYVAHPIPKKTPAMLAAIWGNIQRLEFLIIHQKCDVNARDVNGWTALHWLVYSGIRNSGETMYWLTTHGADLTIETNSGLSFVDIKRGMDYSEKFILRFPPKAIQFSVTPPSKPLVTKEEQSLLPKTRPWWD